ncbi:MAG TPA: hypothetical protein VHV76_14110 [Mycobacteriales bacterium]|jgi:hypothetical protein|nr:hypothetical protein [Mycobacteriales bacterium]
MSVSPLPMQGGVRFDARDGDRAVRVSAHAGSGLVVLSVWRGDRCVATHRMTATGTSELIALLAGALGGLVESPGTPVASSL